MNICLTIDAFPAEFWFSNNSFDFFVGAAIPFAYDINKTTGRVVMSSLASSSSQDYISPGSFRGTFIADERKQQSFLERRRAVNDPWLWALHNDQVAPSMLLNTTMTTTTTAAGKSTNEKDLMVALEEEARKNTKLFAPDTTDSRSTGEL